MNKETSPILSGQVKTERLLNGLLIVVLVIFAFLAIRYQYFLLRHIEWGDESETVVTAKMMAAGQKLYSEIFNHHGPLTFLSGVLLESFGDFGVRGHRVPIALLQWAGLLSIYFSPLFSSKSVKIGCTVFAASVMLLYFPELLGHMYTYQAITGAFLLIILFLYTFPAILRPDSVTPARSFTGSLLIAGLPFLAVTYIPLAGILFLVSLRKRHLRAALAGTAVGVAANLLFLAVYGSLPGYLAFHLYLNSAILPIYLESRTFESFVFVTLRGLTSNLGQFSYFMGAAAGILVLASHEKAVPWRSILLALGIASLLIRGDDFHGLPYYHAVIALVILLTLRIATLNTQAKMVSAFILIILALKVSLVLPGERQYFTMRKIAEKTEFSELVQRFTTKGDKIIAYTNRNFEYIVADRLPASGNFFYFPWQEKYNEDPQYGIKIDACQQIADYRPKVMLLDKWKVWDRFPWESYAGCIQTIVDEHYTQVPGRPYYLRNDIYRADALTP
ncbi:MAG: hypothetical protein LWW96_02625 [Acidovorax sp.]|uniref:hypothetical protein n=1 Tax=Acidovorax sp. TaxID=1872122 RepID=UPI0025B9A98B|nr:hypothetical protein [Acidovorax sp.]MCE1191029.1 hypothetical protein [Acidovorax sp.]